MVANYKKYTLKFKVPGGTSRGVLKTKDSYFIFLEHNEKTGLGECGLLRGLSADDVPEYEKVLHWTCLNIHLGLEVLREELLRFPSIVFGLEQAFADVESVERFQFFESEFTRGNQGMAINGLIWMGDKKFMQQQVSQKLDAGFSCLKMKIGAIDWDVEKEILKSLRTQFNAQTLELRVDANGAFSPLKAEEILAQLAELEIHSIEQPIKKGQPQEMARLCENTPVPIALDEELIGVFTLAEQAKLLDTIKPQYIILKPSFIGGWGGSNQWIKLAEERNVDWWITSALESNVGLNAIAQYTFTKQNKMAQGLGTGSLFTNNLPSPLFINKGKLWFNNKNNWDTSLIDFTNGRD